MKHGTLHRRWPRWLCGALAPLALAAAGEAADLTGVAPAAGVQGGAAPTSLVLARAACQGVPPAKGAERTVWELAAWAPERALSQACGRLGNDASVASLASLEIAFVLSELDRVDESNALVDAIAAEAAAAPEESAASRSLLLYLKAQRAINVAAPSEAAELLRDAIAMAQQQTVEERVLVAMMRTTLASPLRTIRAQQWAEHASSELAQAEALLRSDGLDESPVMTYVYNQRTLLAHDLDDLGAAITWARRELDLYERLGLSHSPQALDALSSLVTMYRQQGEIGASLALLERAVRIVDQHPEVNPSAQIGIFVDLTSHSNASGRPDVAEGYAARALAMGERTFGVNSARLISPMAGLATAWLRLGRYAEALALLDRAYAIVNSRKDMLAARKMRILDLRIHALQQLGQDSDARAELVAALTVAGADSKLTYWRGRLLLRRAAQALRDESWASADADLLQAQALLEGVVGQASFYSLDALAARCTAQSRGVLAGDACERLAAKLPEFEQTPPASRSAAYTALGRAAERAGQQQQAQTWHLRALAAAESQQALDPVWMASMAWAEQLYDSGQPALAIFMGKRAIEVIERLRGDVRRLNGSFEQDFLGDKQAVYRRVAGWLAESGRLAEAVVVLRALKVEEFDRFTLNETRLRSPPGTSEWSAPELQWQRSLPRAATPALAPAPSQMSPQDRQGWQDRWRAQAEAEAPLVEAWQQWLTAARTPQTGRSADARVDMHVTSRAQRPLPPRGELRVWLFSDGQVMRLLLGSHRGLTQQRLAVSPAELSLRVGQLLDTIGRKATSDDALKGLYLLLGAPIDAAARAAGASLLAFEVDGPARYLPFGLLLGPGGHLGDRYRVEYRVPSSSVGSPLRHAPTASGPVLRAFGVSQASADLPALPSATKEVCDLVAGPVEGAADICARGNGPIPGHGWLNGAASADELGRAAEQGRDDRPDYLHLSTHFSLRPGHMGKSWLLLGGGRRMSLADLATLKLRGQDLVTLAACDTGLGGVGGDGAEVDGLNGVLVRSGARAVLASLWRVDDDSTRLLMRAFYGALSHPGMDPAGALQAAQQQVRESSALRRHPFHWAAFYLARATN